MSYLSPRSLKGPLPSSLDPGIIEIRGMGQEPAANESVWSKLAGKVAAPLTGTLTKEAQKIADPLIAKIQPMIREELTRQVPTFGLWAGIGAGALILAGVVTGIITSKERSKARRG